MVMMMARPFTGLACRDRRNPKNGEVVDVPGKRLPYFKVGKELKETIWKES